MEEAILKFVQQLIQPQELFNKRMAYVMTIGDGFNEMLKSENIPLHNDKAEQMTGYTNLMVTIFCFFSIFVLFFISTKKASLFAKKYLMMIFYSMLSLATLTGFFAHTFVWNKDTYNGLWTILYVMMVLALGLRFFQVFCDISFVTGILSFPFILITGYIDTIACWHFDLFVCIGIYVVFFGIIMCCVHFVMVFTRGSHYISYLVSDVIAIFSIGVQVSQIKVGDWDHNAFFHLGVAFYVFFNTLALIIVTVVERNKENKQSDEKLKKD